MDMKDKNIDCMKADLLKEIKNICREVQNIQTFSGLISLESRIYEMSRHLTVLKYLDEKMKITDFCLTQEILPNDPQVKKAVPGRKENQKSSENYRAIQLNINDKVAFENQLFNKDSKAFYGFLEKINHSKSLKEALEIWQEYHQSFHWEKKEDFAKRLEKLVEQRFE